MHYRRLGKTSLMVSVIGFGGVPMRRMAPDEAVRVIQHALDLGVNFIDTARSYATSEEKIGAAMKGRRDRVILASKTMKRTAVEMRAEIEATLRTAGTDYVDLYQIHDLATAADFAQVTGPGGALEALVRAREQGLIRHIGATSHQPGALGVAARSGLFETVQFPFNIIDAELFLDMIPACNELDLGTIAMKPLCGGALQNPPLALRYVLAHAVTTAIPGMESIAQVDENLTAGTGEVPVLSGAEMAALKDEAERLGGEFCRRCGYCQPCAAGVDIPTILRIERYHVAYFMPEWAHEQYTALPVRSDACQDCGECEERCPYNLPVRAMLARAHERLTAPPPAK
jgi:hypothetical protein